MKKQIENIQDRWKSLFGDLFTPKDLHQLEIEGSVKHRSLNAFEKDFEEGRLKLPININELLEGYVADEKRRREDRQKFGVNRQQYRPRVYQVGKTTGGQFWSLGTVICEKSRTATDMPLPTEMPVIVGLDNRDELLQFCKEKIDRAKFCIEKYSLDLADPDNLINNPWGSENHREWLEGEKEEFVNQKIERERKELADYEKRYKEALKVEGAYRISDRGLAIEIEEPATKKVANFFKKIF